MEVIIKENINPKKVKVDNRRKYVEGFKIHQQKEKYHTKWYHENKEQINCPICNKQTYTRFLNQHQKSIKCQLIKNNIEMMKLLEKNNIVVN